MSKLRLFFAFSVVFNMIGTYLGVRLLIYGVRAHDWSTIALELYT